MVRFITVLCASLLAVCQAQAPADSSQTLHVYVNRIQIPVLVLNQYGRAVRPIPESSFRVNLDGLGNFKPLRVRLEGDDPLAVAVIVDASDPNETMWRDLPKAIAKLLPVLNPQDRLTLYGMDGCKAYRYLPEDAALNAAMVREAAEHAMVMKARVAGKGDAAICARGLTMADMTAYVALRLKTFSGRRMIVTVGGAAESGYAKRLDELKALLNAESIMLLSVIHDTAYAGTPVPNLPHRGRDVGVVEIAADAGYGAITELSEHSGGRVTYLSTYEFAGALAEAVKTARGRYIVEFPRPDALAAGVHRIIVTDGHPRDFIRVSGISVPVANAEEIAAARAAQEAALAAGGEATPVEPVAAQPAVRQQERVAPFTPEVNTQKSPEPSDTASPTHDLRPLR